MLRLKSKAARTIIKDTLGLKGRMGVVYAMANLGQVKNLTFSLVLCRKLYKLVIQYKVPETMTLLSLWYKAGH